MSDTHEIKIKNGWDDGNLLLSDNGKTRVYKKDYVLWTIKSGSMVDSIVRIDIKDGYREIFKRPMKCDGSQCLAEVLEEAEGIRTKYAIVWKDIHNNEYTCDPIIAVRPANVGENFISPKIIVGVLVGLSLMLSVFMLYKKNKKG